MEDLGAGEILLTSIDREGTWLGLDHDLIRAVGDAVSIPVIAHGGAGRAADIKSAVDDSGASAVALGSMVVFQKEGMGVLVNFPEDLEDWNDKRSPMRNPIDHATGASNRVTSGPG